MQHNMLSLRLKPPPLRSSFLKAESLDKKEPVYSSQPAPSPSCLGRAPACINLNANLW